VFYFFALTVTGIIPLKYAIPSILLGSVMKIIVEAIMLPVTIRAAVYLKKVEKLDVYDNKTDFNPIKF
jgi:hypothetical protein